MDVLLPPIRGPSRLRLLLDHFSRIEDKRRPEDVAHKLNEILLVCVCATIADCDSFEAISDWGKAHLAFLQRFLAGFLAVLGCWFGAGVGSSGCEGGRGRNPALGQLRGRGRRGPIRRRPSRRRA